MCGLIDDIGGFLGKAVTFTKDVAEEAFHHPLQTLGTMALGPALASGMDMAGIGFGSVISPTGNFSPSFWGDMASDFPGDSGALSLFSDINSVADKIAPAMAGGFAAPSGLFGSLAGTGDAAMGIGAGASTAADTTLGGLEASTGGAGLWGPMAGMGTAIGPETAASMGAGSLGVAGPSTLGALGEAGSGFTSALGGGGVSTGLGGGATDLNAAISANSGAGAGGIGVGATGNAPVADMSNSLQIGMAPDQGMASGAALSPGTTGASAASGESAAASQVPGSQGLSTMFGPDSTSMYSPTGQAISQNAAGAGLNNVQFGELGQGAKGMDLSDITQYASPLMKLFNTGMGAYQQYAKQRALNDYMGQIDQLYSPNSPYAKQMAETLARQDAAAGRNSQYGTRATQLAAALTQDRARALGNNNYYSAATAQPGANMLNTLFSNFSSPQGIADLGKLYQLGSAGFNGLASLFGG